MGSYAELNVFFIKVLPFPARTKVRGISVLNKNNVTGTLVKPTNFLLTTELIVDYDTLSDATKNDPNYFCSVGGSPYPEINGCK